MTDMRLRSLVNSSTFRISYHSGCDIETTWMRSGLRACAYAITGSKCRKSH